MIEGIRIVVECPDCGETRLAPDAVTVRACLDLEAWSYRFTCPKCSLRTVANCPTTAALLGAVRAGAGFEAWALPAELVERPTGPSINLVDELELHRLLLEPDWFAQLAEGMDLDTAV